MSAPRLSELGADPESMLTLVTYFDELNESAANAEAVMRFAALLAECPVGSRWASGAAVRFDGAGRADHEGAAPSEPPPEDNEPAVWLERSGPAHPLDPVLLDRLRHALRAVTTRVGVGGGVPGHHDARAISDTLDAAIVKEFPACSPRRRREQAQPALRFASSTGYGRRAVAYERLSSLEILTELPLDRTQRNPTLARINEIAATAAGAIQISTVEAFCVFGSLRRTADELHVHHSTVAARLARVEAQMGWDLDDPMDRFSATLVLMVRRIARSSAELD